MSSQLTHDDVVLNDIIDMSDIGVYVTDYNTGELLMYNAAYENIVPPKMREERLPYSLIGTKCYSYHHNNDFCSFCARGKLMDENGLFRQPVQTEFYLDSMGVWLRSTSRLIHWNDGRVAQLNTFIDITMNKQQEERMAHIAYFDQRLDIPNGMRLFLDLLTNKAMLPYMIVFDLCGLRKINDVFGREAGDSLLESVRDWLLWMKGDNAELYRIGGDEFVLSGYGYDTEQIMQLARMIYDRFGQSWEIYQAGTIQKVYIGLSMGVIPIAIDFTSYPELINLTERILSSARENNTILVFDEKINKEFQHQLHLEMSLRECVFDNMRGFYVVYQPIVNPRTDVWTGMEALCRWESPDFGNVPPLTFIPIAEQMGLIGIIGDWILEEAIRQVKEWGLEKNEKFLLDVNLSPIQLNDETLCDKVENLLEKYDYPAQRLSLEITESVEIQFHDRITVSLERLNEMGIILSLDDFGTGYSTFSTLHSLPLQIVKTDRSFSHNIEYDNYLQHTVHVMIEFAHVSGMRVVAEGVENEAQRRVLLVEGADLLQGYYYAKPLTVKELTEKLHRFSEKEAPAADWEKTLDFNFVDEEINAYSLTLSQYKHFSKCVRMLCSTHTNGLACTLDKALETACEGVNASICFAYLFDESITGKKSHYYCAHTVSPDPAKISALVEYFIKQYRDKDYMFINSRDKMSEIGRTAFPSVHSLLVLPIKQDNAVLGILGACEMTLTNRHWTRDEIQFMHLFSNELAQTLQMTITEQNITPICINE